MKRAISTLLVSVLLIASMTSMVFAQEENMPFYLNVTGTVTSVGDVISIEDADGNQVNLVVSDNTVYPFESEIAVGDVVTGYYKAAAPMILIWPAQYNIDLLVVGAPEGTNLTADRFYTMEDNSDGYMLSKGGTFAFRTNDDTEIILADGKDFKGGDIEGRRLAVIYGVSTKSLPELATATKIVVLFEDVTTLPEPVANVSEWPILVNGDEIETPAAYQTEDGTVMMPLRAIAEALGFKVEWDAKAYAVAVGDDVKVAIGTEVAEGQPAAALVNNTTYVPLSFFKDVLGMANATHINGQIFIDSDSEDETVE